MKIQEHTWKSKEIQGNPWKIHGNPRKSKEFIGQSMKIQENPWKSKEFQGNPMETNGHPRKSWKSWKIIEHI